MCLCGIGAVRTKEREEHPTIIHTIEVHQRPRHRTVCAAFRKR